MADNCDVADSCDAGGSGSLKVCFCNAGAAAYGADCPTHGQRFCTSCISGYTLINNTCQPNNCNVVNSCGSGYGGSGDYNGWWNGSGGLKVCFCNAGVASYGADCPTHGTRFCLSCNAGYTLVNNTG